MKKQYLILLAFMILVEFISTHSITKISKVNCDPSGKQTFDLEVTPDGEITDLTEFKVTLKNDEGELTAACTLEELSSDNPKESDIDDNIEDSNEAKSDEENELSDLASNAPDLSNQINESDKDENEDDKNDSSSSGSSGSSSSAKPSGSSSSGSSGSSSSGSSGSSSSGSSGSSSSAKPSGSSSSAKPSGSSSSGSTGTRRLQEKPGDIIPVTYVCSLDSLVKPGSYNLEKADNENLNITTNFPIELPPCSSDMISSDEGSDLEGKSEELIEDLKRAYIKLSFRQVLDFDKTNFKFNFIGLTTDNIDAGTKITFMIIIILGKGNKPEPVEVTCSNNLDAKVDGSSNPVAVVSFECKIPEKETEGLESIEIASSEFVAGLPANKTLLNPVLTDAAIEAKLLDKKATMEPPTLAKFEGKITNEMINEGKFEFSLELVEIPEFLKLESTFEMPLVFPEGIVLVFTIIEIKDTTVTFSVEIKGEVNDQPLVLEQTVISIQGKEAFIFPGFATEKITTEGVKEDSDKILSSDEGSDLEGKSSDNEISSDKDSSDNAGEEGKSDEEKGESNELSSDESTDEEGKSSDNVTSSDESGESSDKAGSSDEESTTTGQISTTGTNGTSPNSDSVISDKGNSDEPTPEELKEDALERAEIFITFRQISGFAFVPGTVSFNFFALITQSLNVPYQIKLLVNLITVEGMDDQPTEIECSLDSSVEVKEGETKQASFKCEKKDLDKSKVYTGLRLNSSDSIAGIPTDDETALNPALTDDAIANGEVKDYSKPEQAEIPPSFTFDSMDEQECSKDGKFLIKGTLSEGKKINGQFSIPLTYPEGITLTCSFEDQDIQCIADKELDDSVIIEQMVISEGGEELFILQKVIQDSMSCANGLKVQAEEKTNVAVSFRQVCKIEEKPSGFSFFFFAFVNKNLPQSYVLEINVIVMIGGSPVEKVAKCTLKEAVTVTGSPVQGDFECEVALESGEKAETKDLSLSPNNGNIGGCAELTPEELSPSATDEAIKNGEISDFSLPENKNKVPPSFTISTMNFAKCASKGKIKVEGEFSEEIKEEMTFELPFSFPAAKVKCTVESATAKQKVEIVCKMQKVKKSLMFKQLIIEPRLLKKKRAEMLYVQKANIELEEEGIKCENYNDIKLQLAKRRKENAKFSFIQIGRPTGFNFWFFLALTKKLPTVEFTSMTIEVTLTIEKNRRRNLDTVELDDDTTIKCTPNKDQGTENSCPLNCEGKGSNPVAVEFEDDKISGAPDKVTIDTNPNPDYSKKTALEEFDKLPSLTVTNIASNNCSNTGKYIIEGTFTGTLNNANDMTIPFDSPDSSGLCNLEVESNNFKLNCENKEEFDVSEIMLSPKVVYDKSGNEALFKISNDFTAPKPFACAIGNLTTSEPDSTISSLIIISTDIINGTEPASEGLKRFTKNSKSGLSGGAIAGIVVACVVAIAIVGAVFAISKSSAAAAGAANAASVDNTTSINKFNLEETNPNVV